ncbi:MAG: methyltransferase domain-containing protein [Gemmobacter sp.]|jgi:trans-aconitate 2-methyltransferase|nr:methyltransferase domain-containing protein [Gemmobacter sp.]
MSDWSPASYARHAGLRLRPALDLLAQVDEIPAGPVVDLGCGNGGVGPALAARFPGRIEGVDASPAMLNEAKATGCYRALSCADIAGWQPEIAPALIFSNAALHWLGEHETLLPRLLGLLAPGGVLAVQMPRNHGQPSHRLLREIALAMFPGRFGTAPPEAPVGTPAEYWRLLAPRAAVSVWETDYLQHLGPAAQGHPVRGFTESAAMRPWLAPLSPDEATAFTAAYDAALAAAYPLLPTGGALFPFRRLFLVARI